MRKARWLVTWKDSQEKPVFYHCIGRVVDRRFVLGDEEKEKFRTFMRMYENFSGCRIAAYCLMSNHFHLLLEVPPKPPEGISDEVFLKRLSALYSEAFVAGVAAELAEARNDGAEARVEEIFSRFIYRMNDLTQFMKGLLQRFTQWFNGRHKRKGRLWEDRFKSVIVESGIAARTMAAYIDLNPVRAGIVSDPADYRWCGYGEAIGGGKKGNGKKAREGLVRASLSDEGIGYDDGKWQSIAKKYRQLMGMELERKRGKFSSTQKGEHESKGAFLPELGMAAMMKHRLRYFTDGAVIGSREFVNDVFGRCRDRFSARRKDGARKLRGNARAAAGVLWSARDLRVGV
ncbi:MAG: transposase [Luteolibacter sp.]